MSENSQYQLRFNCQGWQVSIIDGKDELWHSHLLIWKQWSTFHSFRMRIAHKKWKCPASASTSLNPIERYCIKLILVTFPWLLLYDFERTYIYPIYFGRQHIKSSSELCIPSCLGHMNTHTHTTPRQLHYTEIFISV